MSTAPFRTIVVALVIVFSCHTWCVAKERQTVTVSYMIGPARPLPEGLKAVAVIDSGVRTEGDRDDKREAKWSRIAADMIESMLVNGSRLMGSPLSVADRRSAKQILMEKDLKLAGLVDGKTAAQVSQLLDVQGLITSSITVHIDVQKNARKVVDWGRILGNAAREANRSRQVSARESRHRSTARHPRYYVDPRVSRRARRSRPNRGPAMATQEVEEIRRHVTVKCSFSLIDAVSGEAILHYAPPTFQKKDAVAPDFLFGQFVDPGELDPVDHFIGELIERATSEFVGLLVPVPVEHSYELIGRGDDGEAAVRAIRADDFERALALFQTCFRDDSKEHETVFALGVTCELLRQWDQALAYYRQVVSMEDVDEDELGVYLAAKKRLTAHRERILSPTSQPGTSTRPM